MLGPTTVAKLVVLTLLLLALLALPTDVLAGDCGADYAICIAEIGGHGSSDALHETECWGEYLSCIRALMLAA